ncbi:transglutaminase-like domain-containing protein [Microlunatus speluncae]|uniref:transglutaminase-like domain-containing protein n=1 Tax=Microlunatus speluncae TaxID=2594267 RepID=UPI0012667BA4|nr:transglutaminase-like domain-containing protein [Microlunatus speluncae]
MSTSLSPERFAAHSAYSDPGRHAALLREPDGIDEVCAVARNLVFHYRGEASLLRDDRRDEIHSRWVSVILDLDQERHPGPLAGPRPPGDRVAGCCRDHSLLTVAMLREQGVPARTRVGFAGYFEAGYHHDHVVAEWWNGTRWQRADPELTQENHAFDVRDLPTGEGTPFETAAEVWTGYRAGRIDATRYGVMPDSEFSGPGFVRLYVVQEVNHRYGNELLLWDGVGEGIDDELADELARLLIEADGGDAEAEEQLERRFREDPRLRPTDTVVRFSPYGDPPVTVDLAGGPPVRPEPAR